MGIGAWRGRSVGPARIGTARAQCRDRAQCGSPLQLLDLMASPGLTDEVAPCFVAWVTSEWRQHTDDSEDLRIRKIGRGECVDLVLAGEIKDAPSCALILATFVRAKKRDLPADLPHLLT